MKTLVFPFNQEKALVGALSVIVKTSCGTDESFYSTSPRSSVQPRGLAWSRAAHGGDISETMFAGQRLILQQASGQCLPSLLFQLQTNTSSAACCCCVGGFMIIVTYITFSSHTTSKTSHSQQRNNLQLYQQMTCLSIYSSAKLAN